MNKKYEECNYVVCHIGGGISVSAHRKGKMIDGYDIVGGEGPMAPTRCGSISVANLLSYMKENNLDIADVKKLCTRTGGFVSHAGISDALELTVRAKNGDKYAEMLWNTMIYQIEKCIGSMAAVLHGEVDGTFLAEEWSTMKILLLRLQKPAHLSHRSLAYPGEFEMEAMAAGAIRVLNGEENLKVYTGKKVWDGFDWE